MRQSRHASPALSENDIRMSILLMMRSAQDSDGGYTADTLYRSV